MHRHDRATPFYRSVTRRPRRLAAAACSNASGTIVPIEQRSSRARQQTAFGARGDHKPSTCVALQRPKIARDSHCAWLCADVICASSSTIRSYCFSTSVFDDQSGAVLSFTITELPRIDDSNIASYQRTSRPPTLVSRGQGPASKPPFIGSPPAPAEPGEWGLSCFIAVGVRARSLLACLRLR